MNIILKTTNISLLIIGFGLFVIGVFYFKIDIVDSFIISLVSCLVPWFVFYLFQQKLKNKNGLTLSK